ncbi:MAG: hypothetical protein HY062_10065 [Bacteroidetes bacterium]|nr:hypothetical protein [Bacteroidota bacterium]
MRKIILASLVLSTFVFGCKKKSNSTTPEETQSTTTGGTPSGPSITSSTTPQATFNLDGVSKSYISNNNTIFGGSGSSGTGTGSTSYSSDIDDGNSVTYINISKGTLTYTASAPTDIQYEAFYPISSIPYSVNAANGVEISIFINGVEWSTSKGTANQSGSTFNITEKVGYTDLTSTFYVKVKATFSCKVYDGSGASKTITNGVYIGDFGNI